MIIDGLVPGDGAEDIKDGWTVDFLTVRAALRDGLDGPLEMDDSIRYDPR